jgi:hypothetical protein
MRSSPIRWRWCIRWTWWRWALSRASRSRSLRAAAKVSLYARADDSSPRGAVFVPFCYYEAAINR